MWHRFSSWVGRKAQFQNVKFDKLSTAKFNYASLSAVPVQATHNRMPRGKYSVDNEKKYKFKQLDVIKNFLVSYATFLTMADWFQAVVSYRPVRNNFTRNRNKYEGFKVKNR